MSVVCYKTNVLPNRYFKCYKYMFNMVTQSIFIIMLVIVVNIACVTTFQILVCVCVFVYLR